MRKFVGDFETTVYEGQTNTEVWASAIVEIGTESVIVLNSIDKTLSLLESYEDDLIIYYHNLKFDGSFWLDYLLKHTEYNQAVIKNDKGEIIAMKPPFELSNLEFIYSISDTGQWYKITLKTETGNTIEFRDSLKLLPFTVKRIGNSFNTKHKKLEIEYTGLRHANGIITDKEKEYIKNDVLVVKEALEIMFEQGHEKLTIGSCCLDEFKKITGSSYSDLYPDLSTQSIDKLGLSFDEYIRKSYKGGWCYLVKGKENKIYHQGITADVNSLYPSVMHSESGNIYPTGDPTYWEGDYIPDEALQNNAYFFIRIKTCFYLKDGYLPFIQNKHSFYYSSTEMLETSDVYDPDLKRYTRFYTVDDGKSLKDSRMELTLTQTDYYLFLEHYNVVDFEIIDGCYFFAQSGLFDDYLNTYKQIKETSTGALRELAKLFMNNLYGKMASSDLSSYKVCTVTPDNKLVFKTIVGHDKKVGYIPIGSAITSYARNFTIRTAQKNYHGINAPGFIYADTDSIHCDLKANELIDVPVHATHFNHWKLESTWDVALFVRQKTYIEHVIEENLNPISEPYFNIKCAGMPERCKRIFLLSMTQEEYNKKEYTDEENKFISKRRELNDFKVGLCIPGKLLPKRIDGGILLTSTTFEMR